MTYALQEHSNPAMIEQLIAFQEQSAHEVSHRRHHADGIEENEATRFRDSIMHSRKNETIQR